MKKESKNLKSITERNSKMTKVIDIDYLSSKNQVIDFEMAMNSIARKIHLSICNDITRQCEKHLESQKYTDIIEEALKSLKIHAEIKVDISYFIP